MTCLKSDHSDCGKESSDWRDILFDLRQLKSEDILVYQDFKSPLYQNDDLSIVWITDWKETDEVMHKLGNNDGFAPIFEDTDKLFLNKLVKYRYIDENFGVKGQIKRVGTYNGNTNCGHVCELETISGEIITVDARALTSKVDEGMTVQIFDITGGEASICAGCLVYFNGKSDICDNLNTPNENFNWNFFDLNSGWLRLGFVEGIRCNPTDEGLNIFALINWCYLITDTVQSQHALYFPNNVLFAPDRCYIEHNLKEFNLILYSSLTEDCHGAKIGTDEHISNVQVAMKLFYQNNIYEIIGKMGGNQKFKLKKLYGKDQPQSMIVDNTFLTQETYIFRFTQLYIPPENNREVTITLSHPFQTEFTCSFHPRYDNWWMPGLLSVNLYRQYVNKFIPQFKQRNWPIPDGSTLVCNINSFIKCENDAIDLHLWSKWVLIQNYRKILGYKFNCKWSEQVKNPSHVIYKVENNNRYHIKYNDYRNGIIPSNCDIDWDVDQNKKIPVHSNAKIWSTKYINVKRHLQVNQQVVVNRNEWINYKGRIVKQGKMVNNKQFCLGKPVMVSFGADNQKIMDSSFLQPVGVPFGMFFDVFYIWNSIRANTYKHFLIKCKFF